MDIIYLLVPVSLVLVGLIVWALLWAVRSGQFDDLEGPAYKILMDDDRLKPAEPEAKPAQTKQDDKPDRENREKGHS